MVIVLGGWDDIGNQWQAITWGAAVAALTSIAKSLAVYHGTSGDRVGSKAEKLD